MVGGFCGKKEHTNDNYYTTEDTWKAVSPYIPKDKNIWEAFYGDGKSGEILKKLGFSVIHEDIDFFTNNLGDVVVSNPPFSKKKEIVYRLMELDKPFMLLMPYDTLFYKYMTPIRDHLQLIIPKHKMKFISDEKEKPFSFYCVWFCWKMNFTHDLIWI